MLELRGAPDHEELISDLEDVLGAVGLSADQGVAEAVLPDAGEVLRRAGEREGWGQRESGGQGREPEAAG